MGDVVVRYVVRLLPKGAKAEKIRIKTEKLREAKADARKRRLVVRSCARVGRKNVVDDDDVYYPRGRRPREDELEEESYKSKGRVGGCPF